jgi:hypothetical protein
VLCTTRPPQSGGDPPVQAPASVRTKVGAGSADFTGGGRQKRRDGWIRQRNRQSGPLFDSLPRGVSKEGSDWQVASICCFEVKEKAVSFEVSVVLAQVAQRSAASASFGIAATNSKVRFDFGVFREILVLASKTVLGAITRKTPKNEAEPSPGQHTRLRQHPRI